jgi:hypothetical protein
LGLSVPELVQIEVDPALGRNEPDEEIRDLLKASVGLNLGVDYLPGSLTYDPLGKDPVPGEVASAVVWFDAFVLNMDRTPKNPNLLTWHRKVYLIDHGASLYFHHDWRTAPARASDSFAAVEDHVLLPRADALTAAATALARRIDLPLLEAILAEVPDGWLTPEPSYATPASLRHAYRDWLLRRRDFSQVFLDEAIRARSQLI